MSTSEPVSARADGATSRRFIIYAIVLVVVFLLGLVPMWLSARGRAAERDAAQHDLRLCQLENSLMSSAIDSRRGEYERARLSASKFFSSLREQFDQGERADLTSQQRQGLQPLLNQRDDLITLLARSDPASADRLAEMYMSYRKALDAH